ncbi:MAG: hypothetical protein IPG58_12355 [Acidobacteria bacterium]|nr:hypothetical protein [Acidobacteriota bacterium]
MAKNTDLDAAYEQVTAAGHPAVKVTLDSIDSLGQEFFRWEFATSVAGAIMQINPFNQPDVESAKIEARKITDEYEKTGSLPAEEPFFEGDGIKLFSSSEYADKLTSNGENTAAAIINNHLAQITDGDYFGLLGYIEMNPENERSIQTLRAKVLTKYNVATCLGFGPRFLHSTGQAYKGGANNGVFLQITADDAFDLEVPQQTYTFGVVKAAQSRGDFQVLLRSRQKSLARLSAQMLKPD